LEIAILIAQGSFAVGGYLGLRAFLKTRKRESLRLLPSNLGLHLKSGSQMLSFSTLYAILLRSDLIILGVIVTDAELGTYAATLAVAQSGLALSAYFRNRVQAFTTMDGPYKRVLREIRALAFLCLVIVVSALILGPWAADILFGPGYHDAAMMLTLMSILACSQMFLDLSCGILISLAARRLLVSSTSIGALLNVILVIVFASIFGIRGAAIAVAFGSFCAAGVGLILGLKKLSRLESEREMPGL